MKKQSVSKARSKLLRHRHKAAIRSRRPAHKRFLLHPATIFLLLCSGVLLFGLTWKTQAADYTVQARIPAAPLSDPAIITSPKDGQNFSTKPIAVNGTCPYKSYIKLFRNDVFSGTTLCNPDGTFGLLTDLSVGANVLQAHVFNVTDDEGPLSSPVTVHYHPPSSSKPSATPTSPLTLISDYRYKGYKPGDIVSWKIGVSGGSGPYAFNVKWGDGDEANYVQMNAGELDIEHSYAKAGNYTVKLNATDGANSTAFLQLTTIIISSKNGPVAASSGNTSGPSVSNGLRGWLWLLWPSYALLILMAISFWLGERQELYILQHKSTGRRLRHS